MDNNLIKQLIKMDYSNINVIYYTHVDTNIGLFRMFVLSSITFAIDSVQGCCA